jgi:hypothetical protein
MMAQPVLDEMALPLVQEITTQDRRVLSEHKPPGMSGSLVQNLGRRPMRVVVSGVAAGPDAFATAQKLDHKFRAGKPVLFTSDIVADAKLDLVLIEDLRLHELAGVPLRVSYILTLREFIKPIEPVPASGLDSDILGDALGRLQDIASNITAAQTLVTGLEKFLPQFADFLTKLQAIGKP